VIRYHARFVVPITSAPVANGAVAVDGNRITYVGPTDSGPPGEVTNLGDAVLMPGLVNAHCHLELTAMRGFLEDLDFRNWIVRLTTAKRSVFSRDMLLDAARYGVAEGLRHGITAYGDTCDSGVAFDAMHECGVRGIMYQEVFGPDPAQCGAIRSRGCVHSRRHSFASAFLRMLRTPSRIRSSRRSRATLATSRCQSPFTSPRVASSTS
jgi:5-methylthioadenosine/S-adenosylhomocysteine deaminase